MSHPGRISLGVVSGVLARGQGTHPLPLVHAGSLPLGAWRGRRVRVTAQCR